MKLMIASDIHGSSYYCRKMIDAYERENPGRLLLLGSIASARADMYFLI